jgi:hypothetical protein
MEKLLVQVFTMQKIGTGLFTNNDSALLEII